PEDGAVIIHIYGDAYQVESMLGGLIEGNSTSPTTTPPRTGRRNWGSAFNQVTAGTMEARLKP
nr:hypothetical protein [bacterium]